MIIVPISLRASRKFVDQFHRHNKAPQGGKFAVGLAHDNELIGVAIVGRPVARALDDTFTAEVTRVCVVDGAPKGANSKLYAACWRAWRAMGGHRLVTYTLQSESGSSLRGAGWDIIAEVKPKKKPWHGPDRARDYQDVYGQMKFRWEKQIDEQHK